MKPETLQTLFQILGCVGAIIVALSGYGYYHYGQKVEQKEVLITHGKIDNIPKIIDSTINNNTDKVLVALKDVKQSVNEISALDVSNIKEFSYPSTGEFGINILDRKIDKYTVGTYSMNAVIPKNQELTVIISGINWGFPAFQAIPGWRHFDYEEKDGKKTRKFKTVKVGAVDLEFYLTGADKIEIMIYENNSKEPTWRKTITVKNN